MKIVCDNCSAKYSIADEKVAGKVFKIRCKKCSNVIVVRGDQLDAPQEEATQVYDYGGDAIWHVVVDGDQQGPFAPAQIGAMLTDGTIDWEAYVWKEGFEGWQPARDVPELVAAVTGEAGQAQPQPQEPAAASPALAAGAETGGAETMGADPFAAASDAFGGPAPAQDAGADLFAAADPSASPFGGVDEDVVASAPSPRVSQEQASMTGQRNENSVLFSLSNLQALATGGSEAAAASAPSTAKPGHATGEGSGLIDIRALASATAATSGSSSSAPAASGAPEDLLSIGGGIGSSLGAPVLAPAVPEPEKNNKALLIGLGIGGVLVVGLLVALVVVLTQKPEPVATASAPNAAGQPLANPNAAAPAPGTPAQPSSAATDRMPAAGAPVTAMEEAPEPSEAADSTQSENDSSARSNRNRSRSRRSRSGGSSAAMSSSPRSEPSRMTSSMSSRMVSGSIDDLLNQALSMSSSMMSSSMTASMASNLPQQPSRDDVRRALGGISGRVASCGNGTSGVANAAITFASSGRVRSVRVTGVPPAVQSCVARTVRGARVPPFQRSSFNVNFPFRVR